MWFIEINKKNDDGDFNNEGGDDYRLYCNDDYDGDGNGNTCDNEKYDNGDTNDNGDDSGESVDGNNNRKK